MSGDHTIDVGHVHVMEAHGASCVRHCPHPDHDEWKRARGAIDGSEPSEDVIRRIRGEVTS